MKYKCLVILVVIFQSCTDQFSYKTTSILGNSTSYFVMINFYKSGVVYQPNTLEILNSNSAILLIDENDGNGKGLVYPKSISGFLFDSLTIEFDTGKKSVHYNSGVIGQNTYALNYNDTRNFFNEANWEWITTSKKRKRSEYEFKYEITEQDYLNAK